MIDPSSIRIRKLAPPGTTTLNVTTTAPPPVPSTQPTAIVVAADRAIFPLLMGLLHSLELGGLDRRRFALCLIDIGLSPAQRDHLAGIVDRIEPIDDARLVHPRADIIRDIEPLVPFWRALTSRPFLPDYFPGFRNYINLDADTWFQKLDVLDHMVREMEAGRTVIAPEMDPAYRTFRAANLHEEMVKDKHTLTRVFFGDDLANMTGAMPYFNIGLYGVPAGSRHWEIFRHYLTEITKEKFHFLCESVVLNIVLLQLREFTPLPATCNWMCTLADPVRGADGLWRSPTYPFPVIEMLHLTGAHKMDNYGPRGLLFDDGRYLPGIARLLDD